jgi:alpha-L-fucosidase
MGFSVNRKLMQTGLFRGILAAIALSSMASALDGDPYANETQAQRDVRMAWWREAKFGMFIHWGVYAVPAGNCDGKPVNDIGEWIMLNGKIPVERYRKYAAEFNPVKYDPNIWASLAKEAGMRYMVITSKHHDGFALFPSAASKWNITEATPWKNDLIGPLAEAARGQGLKFGLYYSQAQDWINPGGAKSGMNDSEGWDEAHKGSFATYIDQVAVPQTREILTKYQPDVLWWDTPHLMTPEHAAKLAALLPLKPGIIHNNRLGGGYKGDTETPEQSIPATGFPGRDWETCMTMNDTWGYKSDDHNWKPLSTLITNLVDIVSKGGNYLLNVGPTAEGEIPAESIKLLKEVGVWMKTNGEAIYGTQASPFKRLPWGRCTTKPAGEDTLLYLHVFNWPADAMLTIPGLENAVKSAEVLAGGAKITVTPSPAGPVLALPAPAPDPISSTLKLVIEGRPRVSDPVVTAGGDGVIRMLPGEATLHGAEIKLEIKDGLSNIGFWGDANDGISWSLMAPKDGKYILHIESSTPSEGSVIQFDGIGKLACPVPNTGAFDAYQITRVGEVSLTKDAKTNLILRPVADGWKGVNIRKVELVPVP